MNQEMIAAVQRHALDNYTEGGWDYVVESFTAKEIWEVIEEAKTTAEAIEIMGRLAALLREREEETRGF